MLTVAMCLLLQGGLIAATIMASLSRLGGNAHVAKRILRMLSTHLPGRVVLRLGAAKWQANMTGGDFAKAVGSKASLQWAASRLWAAGRLLFTFRASLTADLLSPQEGISNRVSTLGISN